MPEPMPGEVDEGRLRASDGDREAVVERLSRAHAEGRLDLAEFDERTRCAYAARTYAELAALTIDLPAARPASAAIADVTTDLTADGAAPTARRDPSPQRPRGRELSRRIVGSAWFSVSLLTVMIWAVSCVATGGWVYPWWIWVAGPWGAVLLADWLRERFADER